MRPKKNGRPKRNEKPWMSGEQPTALDTRRAEKLREVLEALFLVNATVPIVVEGKKDAAALRKLGLTGEIITLHRGRPLHDFCEHLAEEHDKVVLLPDWDTEGENLMRRVSSELKGHWEEHARFRESLRSLCQKEIKDIEGIPRLLRRLDGDH